MYKGKEVTFFLFEFLIIYDNNQGIFGHFG